LGVDLLSLSAHKANGPVGAGLLYARRLMPLQAQLLGGNQERNRRAGTEPLATILGMARAFELAYADLDARRAHLQGLTERLIAGLLAAVDGAELAGPTDPAGRLPHLATLCFRYVDGEA